ncbi:MAG: Coenzyme F420 hydrogenase/dehydrogenase, beta subunit C-terminal domain [Bacteroidales bacterium]|nr:Coenzyme F420 hydrogenase/dehydrogenase, beta subunit C-terminal domain [Bacteroidales bacterium]
MSVLTITEQCTGCRACEQLCIKNAIEMSSDAEGFLTAKINDSKCVNCGACRKICPQNNTQSPNAPKNVFAVRLKDNEVLRHSASGGAFAGISTEVLRNGGVAFGVKYDTRWDVQFVKITDVQDLCTIQSSKYVQADTLNSFVDVKTSLQNGKTVLYAGTGCQIGGLKAFLKHDYPNLITIDLICHGVTSPLLFKKYIKWLEQNEDGKILEYNFRDKSIGWGLDYLTKTRTRTRTRSCGVDPYYHHFLKGDMYRECCYQCKYAKQERPGDFTIGDFWGIGKEHPDFFSSKGVSCILLNTDKAIALWVNIQSRFHFVESTFDKVSRHNGNLLAPTVRPQNRDGIYDGISVDADGIWFERFAKKFKPSLKARIKSFLPIWLLKLLK